MKKQAPFLPTHVHKYRRKRFPSGYVIYKCVTCAHFIDSRLLPGRENICWRCGGVFIALEKDAQRLKPHCLNCTRGNKETKEVKDILQILEQEKIL